MKVPFLDLKSHHARLKEEINIYKKDFNSQRLRGISIAPHTIDIAAMWAILTRARPDEAVMVLPNIPSFYRDPHRDHWGRLAIDATAPYERRHEFERKRVPGAREVDLSRYLKNWSEARR